MIDPETLQVINTILLLVLLVLAYLTTRRTKRIMAQDDDVLAATVDVQAQVQALTDQQAKTGAAILAAIARVEAIITALGNTNDPKLDAAINSLHAMKDQLSAAVATETQEQTTADAERPTPPPA